MIQEEDYQRLDKLHYLIRDPFAADDEIETVFLELMADELLAIGHQYYRQRGRGTLLFDVRGALGWRSGSMPTLYYLTYPDLVEAGNPSDAAKEEIDSYNPDHQVPVLFVYSYGGNGKIISKDWDLRATRYTN